MRYLIAKLLNEWQFRGLLKLPPMNQRRVTRRTLEKRAYMSGYLLSLVCEMGRRFIDEGSPKIILAAEHDGYERGKQDGYKRGVDNSEKIWSEMMQGLGRLHSELDGRRRLFSYQREVFFKPGEREIVP